MGNRKIRRMLQNELVLFRLIRGSFVMLDILLGALGAFLILIGLTSGVLAWRVLRSTRAAYQDARDVTGSFQQAASGGIRPIRGGIRDHRVAAGLSLTKDNSWQVEGRLSNETVRSLAGRNAS